MKRYVDVLLPLVAVAAVGLATVLPSSVEPDAAPEKIQVVETSYACPAGSNVTVAAGQVTAGEERTVRLADGSTDDTEALSDPAGWSTASIDATGLIVTETGRRAGAEGFYSLQAKASAGGGLVVGRCAGVVEDAWYLGLGSADRRASTVVLANLSASPAIADLTLWGPQGEVDAIDATGIALEPHEVRRIPVADLAAGEPLMALRVERRRGVLSALVEDGSTATFSGSEPLEPTREPSTEQIVPGLAGGVRGKTLFLFNPGDRSARVGVQVIGGDGPFADSALQDVKVAAGTIQQVEIPISAGRGRQAYKITSDQPVAASVRIAPGTKDYVHLEAGLPLDGQALVPISLGKGIKPPRLVLTAPGDDAKVTVTAFDASMKQLGAATEAVRGGTTQAFDTTTVAKGAAYLVVEAKGSVIGAATYVDGDRVSSMLLRPVPATIDAPVVRPAE